MCVYINIPIYLFFCLSLYFPFFYPVIFFFLSRSASKILSPLSFSSLNYFPFSSFNLFSSFPHYSFLHGLFLFVSVRSLFFWKNTKRFLTSPLLEVLTPPSSQLLRLLLPLTHLRHHRNSFHCCCCSHSTITATSCITPTSSHSTLAPSTPQSTPPLPHRKLARLKFFHCRYCFFLF